MIELIMFHIGNQAYFQQCVRANAKHNKVVLIGDASNAHMGKWNNIEHVMHTDLITDELKTFQKHFVNYSTNPAMAERFCFERIFHIDCFLKKRGLKAAFHLDSDCVLLEKLENIILHFGSQDGPLKTAYSLNRIANAEKPFKMAASVHNGILTHEFCRLFKELCHDIYVSKTKLKLLQPKIKWHKDHHLSGGICDMTLYHLIATQGILEVADLEEPNDDRAVFNHHVSTPLGYKGENTYKMLAGRQVIEKRNDKYYLVDAETDERLQTLTLHFQGTAKALVGQFLEFGNT